MGKVTTDVNGTRVYNSQMANYADAVNQKAELQTLRAEINDDKSIPKEKRDALNADIDRAERLLNGIIEDTSRQEIGERSEDKPLWDGVPDRLTDARTALAMINGAHTDAQMEQAAKVPPPPQSPSSSGAASSPDQNTPTSLGTTPPARPPIPDSQSFDAAMNNDATKVAEMIMDGTLKLSNEDLRALSTADAGKFTQIMGELAKDTGGATRANAMQTGLQSHMQSLQRMFTLESNMNQAEHDTKKALIGNLRV